MASVPRIVLLPGDGIGPEIVAATRRMLEALGEFEFEQREVGGVSIEAHGVALTDAVLEACRGADAVLLGAVGGPQWDTTDPDAPAPSRGCSGCARGWGSTPTCARSGPARRCSPPARCARSESPVPTCSWCAS